MSSDKIAELNNLLSKPGIRGEVVMIAGVNALGTSVIKAIILKIMECDDFAIDNDFYQEFNSVKIDGRKIFWIVDELIYDFENSSNPSKITLCLTLMLSVEE